MGAWAESVKDSIKVGADESTDMWLKFKKERPGVALALSVLPVSGQITAAAEYYDAMKRGDSTDAVLAALQFIPAGGAVKAAKIAGEAAADLKSASAWAKLAKLPPPAGMSQARATNVAADMAARERGAAVLNAGKATGALAPDVGNANDVADYLKDQASPWAAAMNGATQ